MALISIGIQPTTIIVLNNFITRIGCWFTTYRYLENFVNMNIALTAHRHKPCVDRLPMYPHFDLGTGNPHPWNIYTNNYPYCYIYNDNPSLLYIYIYILG